MTDLEVSKLEPGMVVHEATGAGCLRLTVTGKPEPPDERRHYHVAWAVSDDGRYVAGITQRGQYHLPALHKARVVEREESR